MTCPSCSRPLWRDLAANLYRPRTGQQSTTCRHCAAKATYQLPGFLSDDLYVYFGALLIALTMLAALSAECTTAIRVQLCTSVFVTWLGLIALLTWTKTRVK